MALSSRDLKTVGSVIGAVIFIGPLVAMYISTKSWKAQLDEEDARKAAEARREMESRRMASARRRSRTPLGTINADAPKSRGGTVRTDGAQSGGEPAEQRTPETALTIELKRTSRYSVEVVFHNASEDRIWLAVPDAPGGLLRVDQPGQPLGATTGVLFDEERDDYVVPLKAGASHAVAYKKYDGFPPGKIRATYDSQGDGLPEKAWRGRSESNIAPELEWPLR
jgi:hypothetical protein